MKGRGRGASPSLRRDGGMGWVTGVEKGVVKGHVGGGPSRIKLINLENK